MYVLVEGVLRLLRPPEVPSTALVVFGVVALVGNLVSLAVLSGGRSASLNLRAAFLEVLNDALGSVGVIVAAIVIATTGWYRADAVAGLVIGALILPRAFVLLRVEHVRDVHDLHASLIATGLQILDALEDCVATRFDVPVEHSTFQLEPASYAALEAPGHP